MLAIFAGESLCDNGLSAYDKYFSLTHDYPYADNMQFTLKQPDSKEGLVALLERLANLRSSASNCGYPHKSDDQDGCGEEYFPEFNLWDYNPYE